MQIGSFAIAGGHATPADVRVEVFLLPFTPDAKRMEDLAYEIHMKSGATCDAVLINPHTRPREMTVFFLDYGTNARQRIRDAVDEISNEIEAHQQAHYLMSLVEGAEMN